MEKYFYMNFDFKNVEKLILKYNVRITKISNYTSEIKTHTFSLFNFLKKDNPYLKRYSYCDMINNLIKIYYYKKEEYDFACVFLDLNNKSHNELLDIRYIIASVTKSEDFLIIDKKIKEEFDFNKFNTLKTEEIILFLETYNNEIIEFCNDTKMFKIVTNEIFNKKYIHKIKKY